MRKSFADKPFKLLDVGAGNHSASRITSLFTQCEYYGLDLDKSYNNDEYDFDVMKGFYELDLTKLNFAVVPDEYFDGIWMAHVIEHLYNGDEVVKGLLKKLKPGGYFIFSVPNLSSLHNRVLFSLGFQPTSVRVIGPHVRGYAYNDMPKFLEFNNHFKIVKKIGVGFYPSFYPLTNILARSFKGLSHTVIWVLQKQSSKKKNWQDEIESLDLQSEF